MRPVAIGALFIFTGLLLIFVFTRSRTLRKREQRELLSRSMREAAQIAQAAAADGFGVTLDETDDSIQQLESVVRRLTIAENERVVIPRGRTLVVGTLIDTEADRETEADSEMVADEIPLVIDDSVFVCGAYLGMIANLRHGGVWHEADELHTLPWLYFEGIGLELEPFLLIERQIAEPAFSLSAEYNRFLQHKQIAEFSRTDFLDIHE